MKTLWLFLMIALFLGGAYLVFQWALISIIGALMMVAAVGILASGKTLK